MKIINTLKKIPLTLYLAFACIFVFFLQSFIPTEFFTLKKYDFHIWQVFTSVFAHADINHLISNLFVLTLFGWILESIIGKKNYIYLFLLTLITTSIVSLIFYPSVLGISGIVYGIFGCLGVLRPRMIVFVLGVPIPIILAMGIWSIFDFSGILYPYGVANLSHIFGMITGIIFGMYLRKKYVNDEKKEKGRKVKIPNEEIRKWEEKYLLRAFGSMRCF